VQIFLVFSCRNTIFAPKKEHLPIPITQISLSILPCACTPTTVIKMNKFEKTLHFIKDVIREDSPFYRNIYLVGGCVRDELLGERYSDIDLLVNMPSGQKAFIEYMCTEHADRCKGPFYYQRYGTTAMDVIIDGSLTLVECVEPHIEEYDDDDITLLETRFCSLEEDASRRDYTCNALYKNLHTGEVLDPTGRGISDLKDGLLITPSDPVTIYRQDPVRMLRGIRFKHQKGFHLDSNCWKAICENAHYMANSSPKRLRDELNKLLKSRTFGDGIQDLMATGLLQYVIPGIEEHFVNQHPHEGAEEGITLWGHTYRALSTQGREHPRTDTIYKLACLMMDIALVNGRDEAGQILSNAGIGREKVASILHITELYERYRLMFEGEKYIAAPRVLTRFRNSLSKNRDNFRRLVRAENSGLLPEVQLPWRLFYDDGEGPQPRQRCEHERRNNTPASLASDHETSSRNHKRNVKRREQRKRARSRRRNTESM